jgi:peptidoglycan/LPS O-acetylase OafA/YrhL
MTLLRKLDESHRDRAPAVEPAGRSSATLAVGEISQASSVTFTAPRKIEPRSESKPDENRRDAPSSHYKHRGRSLPLDMLRGVAILLVLGRHYVVLPENLGWVQPFAGGWTTIGWAGVDLFFVLSGFLVSGLLFAEYRKHQTIDVRRFVLRRGFKIWPPYLVYIGVIALWLGWKLQGNWSAVWTELWPNVFHVQNYFHTPRVHTWSLAVEEHFYLAVALAFLWVLRSGKAAAILRQLPAIIVGLVAGLAALRSFTYWREGVEQLNLYATHLRFDGLLIGTLLAYWTHFEPEKIARFDRRPMSLLMGGVALALPALIFSPEASALMAGIGLTAMYAGFGMILVGWLRLGETGGWAKRMFATRAAALLGQVGFYSYSIYLWHVDLAQTPVKKLAAYAMAAQIPAPIVWIVLMAVYVCAAFLVGSVLARLLEIPALKLRDRLLPAPAKAVAAG